jgi:hypothetical protein
MRNKTLIEEQQRESIEAAIEDDGGEKTQCVI